MINLQTKRLLPVDPSTKVDDNHYVAEKLYERAVDHSETDASALIQSAYNKKIGFTQPTSSTPHWHIKPKTTKDANALRAHLAFRGWTKKDGVYSHPAHAQYIHLKEDMGVGAVAGSTPVNNVAQGKVAGALGEPPVKRKKMLASTSLLNRKPISEAINSAQDQIDKTFENMHTSLSGLHAMTKPGGVLHRKIQAEGGDVGHLADLHKHLTKALDKHEDAHQSTQMSFMDS